MFSALAALFDLVYQLFLYVPFWKEIKKRVEDFFYLFPHFNIFNEVLLIFCVTLCDQSLSLSRRRFYCLTVTDIILNNPVSSKLQLHCPYLRV